MADIPIFKIYGEDSEQIQNEIQSRLPFRNWVDLDIEEKETACQELINRRWIRASDRKILITIEYLNEEFLRRLPGYELHHTPYKKNPGYHGDNETERREIAVECFCKILIEDPSDALIYAMLSRYAKTLIDTSYVKRAEETEDPTEREAHIDKAYNLFDRFAYCLEHIFEQFSVNQKLVRTGLIPRQDDKITKEIYEPVLLILADPKWKTLNDDIEKMFGEFRGGNHPEVITKVHGIVHRFLQILVGEEGKSGKGEVGKLYNEAIKKGKIPVSRFTESMVKSIQSFIVAERANKSSAKPAKEAASPEDALLNMNVLMVFLQHCLKAEK